MSDFPRLFCQLLTTQQGDKRWNQIVLSHDSGDYMIPGGTTVQTIEVIPRRVADDSYRRGFEAARAAAIKAIDDTPAVYPRDTREAQLGDAEATKYAAIDAVAKLTVEAASK